MSDFTIFDTPYVFAQKLPRPKARFGLAISYWKTNLDDLLFQLRLVNRWLGRELIEVSVCSAYYPDKDAWEAIHELADNVVHCQVNGGHQNGTTMQCNGAIAPLWREGIDTVTHTDADTPILHPAFFFGYASLLLNMNRLVLTSNNSFDYNDWAAKLVAHPELGPGSQTDHQFGSMFVLNRKLLCLTTYWPFRPCGNFESDRYTQFVQHGRKVATDAIIVPRVEFKACDDLLDGIDMSLGVMHNTNATEHHKQRMLVVMGLEDV